MKSTFAIIVIASAALLSACGPSKAELAAKAEAEQQAADDAERARINADAEKRHAEKIAACETRYATVLANWTKAKDRFAGIDVQHPETYAEMVDRLGKPDAEHSGISNEHLVEWLPSPRFGRDEFVDRCSYDAKDDELIGAGVSASFVTVGGAGIDSNDEPCDVTISFGFPGRLRGLALGGTIEDTKQQLLARGARPAENPPTFYILGDYGFNITYEGNLAKGDTDKLGEISSHRDGCFRI